MKNPHIVVGPDHRCLCGVYGGTALGCAEILGTLDRIDRAATGSGGSAALPVRTEIELLRRVITTLVEDRPEPEDDHTPAGTPAADVFWGRCAPAGGGVHRYGPHSGEAPYWRKDGTCSFCGGERPSVVLNLIRRGAATIEPTDKNYKIYVQGLTNPANPAHKCYLNHFSEAQAVEFVLLWQTGKMKLAHPGSFYSGLCFGLYKEAIQKALAALKATPPEGEAGQPTPPDA